MHVKSYIEVRQVGVDAEGPTYRVMKRHVEIEIPLSAEYSLYLYIIPMGEAEMLIAASFDDFFDTLEMYLNNPAARVPLRDTWPTLYYAWIAGMQVNLEESALVKLTDTSDDKAKWMFATKLSGHDPYSMEAITGHEVTEVVLRVARQVLTLRNELRTRDLPNPKSELAKAVATAVGSAVLAWWRIIDKE
jgi:hypothetical protein